MLDFKDNSNLRRKFILMKIVYHQLEPLSNLYQRMDAAENAYNALLEYEAQRSYKLSINELKRHDYESIVNQIYTHAYAYRAYEDPNDEDHSIDYKHKFSIRWLFDCINEAIEETVIKVPSEKLIPEKPLVEVERYMWLKIFPQWKPINIGGADMYYINEVGDYYDIANNIIIQQSGQNQRYLFVNLKNGDTREIHHAHQDVAKAFVNNPDPDNFNQVNHINGVKTCNAVFNLEWTDQQGNADHAAKYGLVLTDEDHPMSKYTNDQYENVCKLLTVTPIIPVSEISIRTGVSVPEIKSIYRRKTHREISAKYEFAPREDYWQGEKCNLSVYSDEQAEMCCKIMMYAPSVTFDQIEAITGVDSMTVSALYRKKIRRKITDKYDFPPRETQAKGARNANTKYNDEQLIESCKLLKAHPDWPYSHISALTGVSVDVLQDMVKGYTHKDITKDFMPFPPRDTNDWKAIKGESNSKSVYSDAQAENVCCMLDDKYLGKSDLSLPDISKRAKVSLKFVQHLWYGSTRQYIAKNHIFYKERFGDD